MIVMKFGGTSTQDAAAMVNVAHIVKAHLGDKPVVVISAIAQATNALEKTGKLASEGKPGEARDTLLKLFDRHYAIADELIKDKQHHTEVRKFLASSLAGLEELVHGVAILHELTPRTLDAFYCYGELMSSRIVAAVLQGHGMKSQWLDTKDFMITDENHNGAAPQMEIVERQLKELALPLLDNGVVPVTQGFIGMTPSGRRTTMGRESSDYSASIIGAALNAQDVQIWTDVDGILTADPRVVSSPKKIRTLSFEEAFELSYFGAKVLHPDTMLPAIEKNIPIHVFNSKRPHLSGTLVTSNSHADNHAVVKSVAYKRNVTIFTMTPRKRFSQFIFWEHIYSIFTKHRVAASLTVTSEYNVSIVLDGQKPAPGIIHDLEDIGFVRVFENKGILSIVGSNIQGTPHIIEKIFQSISDFGISMVSFGASKSSVSIIIDDEHILDAVRRIHRDFFEGSNNENVFEALEHISAQA